MEHSEEKAVWQRWKTLNDGHEEAQKMLLAALYKEDFQPRIRAWRAKVGDFDKRRGTIGLEEVHQANEEILALMLEGQRLARELAPYLESGVEPAVKDDQQDSLEKHLIRLVRQREWNYNRSALDHIEKVGQSGGTPLEKLRSLVMIDEARLAPYVGQRFLEAWKRVFDKCSQEEQVEATKFRILREYQQ